MIFINLLNQLICHTSFYSYLHWFYGLYMKKDKNSEVGPWAGTRCAKILKKYYQARVVHSFCYFDIYIVCQSFCLITFLKHMLITVNVLNKTFVRLVKSLLTYTHSFGFLYCKYSRQKHLQRQWRGCGFSFAERGRKLFSV